MLEGIFKGLVSDESKAQAASDMIGLAMASVSGEFNLPMDKIAFFIRPGDQEWTPKVYAVEINDGKPVRMLREVTLLEVVKAGNTE